MNMEKYFRILGVTSTATIMEIKHAFFQKIESLQSNQPEINDDVERRTKNIVEAYNYIMNHYDEYQKNLQGNKEKNNIRKPKDTRIKSNLLRIFGILKRVFIYIWRHNIFDVPFAFRWLILLARGVIIIAIILVTLLTIWLIVCIIINNGITKGTSAFIHGKFFAFIMNWYGKSFEYLTRGDIQGFVIGILRFFAPLPLAGMAAPSDSIEIHDSKGNKYKITKD